MKDSKGYDYAELLTIQEHQLEMWKIRLKLSLWVDIAGYVRGHNREGTPETPHQVYRGQDIVQIIMEWPNPSGAYKPRIEAPSPENVI